MLIPPSLLSHAHAHPSEDRENNTSRDAASAAASSVDSWLPHHPIHLVVEVVHRASGLVISKGSASFRMAESGDLEFPSSGYGSGLDTSAADNGEESDEDANDDVEEEEEGGVSLKNQRPFTANSCYLVDIVTDPLLDRQVRCILDLPPVSRSLLCVGAVCMYVLLLLLSLCYVPCPPFFS